MAENDAEPTRALSAPRQRPSSAGAPRPAGVAAQTLRGGGELSRMQSERPRCGGAPASCGRQPRGRTVPRGWTVFQLPSTPWVLWAVRSDMCGRDSTRSRSDLVVSSLVGRMAPGWRAAELGGAHAAPGRRQCRRCCILRQTPGRGIVLRRRQALLDLHLDCVVRGHAGMQQP